MQAPANSELAFIAQQVAAELCQRSSGEPFAAGELAGARDRLDGLLQIVTDGVVVADQAGRLLYANAAAAALHGFSSGVTLVAASAQELEARLQVLDEWGQPVLPQRLPLLALRSPETPSLLLRFRDRVRGEDRFTVLRVSVLRDEQRRVLALVALYRDTTEQRRTEESLRLLSRAGAMLAGPLDLGGVLDNLGRLLLADLADAAELHLSPQDVALGWPARLKLSADGAAQELPGPASPPLSASELWPELPAVPGERLRAIAESGCSSALAVPLSVHGRALGALVLGARAAHRRFGPTDLALAEDLAARAASALEGARRIREVQLQRDADRNRLQSMQLAHRLACTLERDTRVALGLSSCADALRREVSANAVRIWSCTDSARRLTVQASAFEPGAAASEAAEALEVQRIATTRMVRVVSNTLADPVLCPTGPGAWVGLPLIAQGEVVGALSIFFARPPLPGLVELLDPSTEVLALSLQRRMKDDEGRRTDSEAVQESRRKDEFIAMLAHELRNPLAPIVTALQLMRTRGDDGRSVARERSLIERQVAQMARLVDDLLDVSRIKRGKLELRKEPVDLASVVSRAVESAQPLITRHRHTLSVALPEQPIFLVADPARLQQIFTNLLTNAVKYSPVGGRIRLMVERDGEQALVRVRDTGIGISPEMQASIFEPFVQAGGGPEHAQGGLGIGLSLVRALAELHGGVVSVASGGAGTGSEFSVRLPALPDSDIGLPLPPPPHEEALASGAGRRVMVVDDNRDAAEMLAEALQLWGCDVRVANDGASALEAAAERRPDIILLDIGMPGMDGFEVARRLRKNPALRGVRLVAVTGYGREMDFERSRDAGFDAHLTKPVELDVLQRTILDAQPQPGTLAAAEGADELASLLTSVAPSTNRRPRR